MAYPIPVPEPIEQILTTYSDENLEAVRQAVFGNPNIDRESATAISNLIRYELELRQQEPLWRKASRWYKRNKNTINDVSRLVAVFAAAFGGAATYDHFDNQ